MEKKDLIKSFVDITCIEEYEKWNDEIFTPATDEELDVFWDWADQTLFNQIWDTLTDKLGVDYESSDEQHIECDVVQFEFVPDSIQEHIIKYFCGDDLACSLTLMAPMELDIEEIAYEDNTLTFSGIVFDC